MLQKKEISIIFQGRRQKLENEEKGLTTNGMTGPHTLLIILSMMIIGVSVYLTKHYYDLNFNMSLEKGHLCDINSFWTCDKASKSAASKFFNVPTSVFGLIVGLVLMLGSVVGHKAMEKTTKSVLAINALFCTLLFFYSLFILKSLCPMCTLYYVLSFL